MTIKYLKLETREDLLVAMLPEHLRGIAPAMLETLSRYGNEDPQNLESYMVGLYIEALEREVIRLQS